jgi:cytochrome b subunit of formate dehydrogenase
MCGISPKREEFAGTMSRELAANCPAVPRHSLAARLFHWIMAASMFTLLFTAFLPKVGVQFDWVTYHWIAGSVLTVSVIFHVIHASFWLDFWAIWPDKPTWWTRGEECAVYGPAGAAAAQIREVPAREQALPRRDHRDRLVRNRDRRVHDVPVHTIFFPRNPYLFSDMTWGLMYVLHGLAGIGLIALVMVHVYFAIRPEKLDITKSMIFGSMRREFYLKHYDPERWVVEATRAASPADRSGNS